MEKNDHPVLFRALVDGPVAPIVVILEGAGEFPQSAETRGVEAVYEFESEGIIKIHLPQAHDTVGMLGDERFHAVEIFGKGQEEGKSIRGIELGDQLFQERGIAIIVDVHIDQPGRGGLRHQRPQADQKGQRYEAESRSETHVAPFSVRQ